MWNKVVNKARGGVLWVVSGPSGSGKTTICQGVLRHKHLGLQRSISYTTRSRKRGERNKEDYVFISKKKFLQMRKAGRFLEWQEVFGNFYGTAKNSIERIFAKRNDVLLCIDVKGALEIKRKFPNQAVFIFIIPPDEKALKQRLHIRARDEKKEMHRRLKFAKIEISYARHYDYIVVNDKLNQAVRELESIIITKRLENVLHPIRKCY